MTIAWIAVLACISLLVLLVSHRSPAGNAGSLSRLARLHGVHPLRGESEESLRHRTTAASRWPYSYPEPQFIWWARAWHRLTAALSRR
jgi:hypothetical protein